ncbi:T9SS type A sorting domain-containing protein [Litoribaculum gwangyangense]
MSNLPKGLYVLRIRNGKIDITKKLIKQ